MRLDGFELRVTPQLEDVQSLDIVRVKAEVAELQKLVMHEWPVYPMHVILEIQLEKETENIQGTDETLRATDTSNKKNKKMKSKRTKKDNMDIVVHDSMQNEYDQQVKVQEKNIGISSSISATNIERGSDTTQYQM